MYLLCGAPHGRTLRDAFGKKCQLLNAEAESVFSHAPFCSCVSDMQALPGDMLMLRWK